MTKEQFEDIKSRLAKWREARGLSVAGQKANFKVNYVKELLEFYEAERDGNEYEMIDALCDMIITAINAGRGLSSPYISGVTNIAYEVVLLAYDSDYDMGIIELCNSLRYYGYNPYQCLLETIKELNSRSGSWSDKEGKWCKDKGAYSKDELNEELVKNICQEDDDYWYYKPKMGGVLGKVKKWYKANYAKCKLEVENV